MTIGIMKTLLAIVVVVLGGVSRVSGQTTNTFLNLPFDSIPGIAPTLLSLNVVTRSDFTNRPVFIYVHGGSWESGDKNNVALKDDYALSRGYVFVSVNFRRHWTRSLRWTSRVSAADPGSSRRGCPQPTITRCRKVYR